MGSLASILMGVSVVNKCFNQLAVVMFCHVWYWKQGGKLLNKNDKGRGGGGRVTTGRQNYCLLLNSQGPLVLSYFGDFDFIPNLFWLIPNCSSKLIWANTPCVKLTTEVYICSLQSSQDPWKAWSMSSVQAPNRTFKNFHYHLTNISKIWLVGSTTRNIKMTLKCDALANPEINSLCDICAL
jgi:hypothetical protein